MNELPVVFKSSVFKGFLVILLHNLNAGLIERSAHVLHNMKAVKDDFGARKQLFNDRNVAARHVHGYHFNLLTNPSRRLVEVVFDG